MIRKLFFIIAASLPLVVAQSQQSSQPMIFPPPVAAFTDVKQYLGLSDAQIEQLRQILSDKDRVSQESMRVILQKQEEINQLLAAGSEDAFKIGSLNIDIHKLRGQANGGPEDVYRQRALAVLTPEQRTKLASLEQILKLTPAANQAVTLLLLQPLPPGPPVILSHPEADNTARLLLTH